MEKGKYVVYREGRTYQFKTEREMHEFLSELEQFGDIDNCCSDITEKMIYLIIGAVIGGLVVGGSITISQF